MQHQTMENRTEQHKNSPELNSAKSKQGVDDRDPGDAGYNWVATKCDGVVLDTTVVPDIISLHPFNEKAPLVRVLPGVSRT